MRYVTYTLILLITILIMGCKPNSKEKQINQPETIIEEESPSFYIKLDIDTLPIEKDEIGLTFYNNSSQDAEYGSHFKISFYRDSVWVEIHPASNVGFNDLAYHLQAGESKHYKHWFTSDTPIERGRYRISTEISITLESEFYVAENVISKKDTPYKKDNQIIMTMDRDSINTETDSISCSVINNINNEAFALEHYFLSYYDNKTDNWLDYYYLPYVDSERRELQPGKSTQFSIIPNNPRWFRYGDKTIYKNKQSIMPGKYRIRKYVKIPVSAEFTLQ